MRSEAKRLQHLLSLSPPIPLSKPLLLKLLARYYGLALEPEGVRLDFQSIGDVGSNTQLSKDSICYLSVLISDLDSTKTLTILLDR